MINGLCVFLLFIAAACGLPAADEAIAGWFSQYDETPTVHTLDYRQDVGELPFDLSHYSVYVATVMSCDVGASGWIRPVMEEESGNWERFVVFDCAGHAETVENFFGPNSIIGEIDYWTALRWDTVGHGIQGEIVWD